MNREYNKEVPGLLPEKEGCREMKKGSWKFFRVFFSATGAVITVLLAVAATTIFFSIQWMFQTWSNLTLDELVYHLNAPLEGTNEGMVTEYLTACVVPAILVLLFFLVLFLAFRRQKKYFVLMGAGILLSLLLAGTSVYAAWNKLGAGDYV